MSLFKRVHTVSVPKEFLEEGEAAITLRFSQLNSKKMAKANLSDTLDAIERQNIIMDALSDAQREASIDRQKNPDPEATKRAQERAEEPDDFDDFDQPTLVALAHVHHKPSAAEEWTEFTSEQIDELVCLDWLAGQIYDVSLSRKAPRRGKKTSRPRGSSESRGTSSFRSLDRVVLRKVPQAPLRDSP